MKKTKTVILALIALVVLVGMVSTAFAVGPCPGPSPAQQYGNPRCIDGECGSLWWKKNSYDLITWRYTDYDSNCRPVTKTYTTTDCNGCKG